MDLNSCRLCLSVQFLTNVYQIDGEVRLDTKITYCLDVKLHPKDNLPVMICKQCKKTVQKFYKFKQKCLKVNLELKAMTKSSKDTRLDQNYTSTESECDIGDSDTDFLEHESSYLQKHSEQGKDGTQRQSEVSRADNEWLNDYNPLPTQKIENNIQCHHCGYLFQSRTHFRNHQKLHGLLKPFQCEYCNKQFTRSENKIVHTRSHFGIKPFVCEICGQTSTKHQDLKRHMKIHSDEKNHECQTCGSRFKRSGDLRTHVRTHTGARPYVCQICRKTYTSHSGLRKHKKSAHS